MKVFLTGASGILGTDIADQLRLSGHRVLPFNSQNIEIGNYEDVSKKVNEFNPDVVIHSAAMTNVDLCEDDREAAYQINVTGSQNMAMAAAQVGAKIVYISSCGVYGNGKTEAYTEHDETHPLNYHHLTKLEGEIKVKESNLRFLIIRPGWLFGGTTAHKKNFVEARRREAEKASQLQSAGDKIGSPTYTADVAKKIIELIDKDLTGVFNLVNEECASRYDYVAEIVRLFKYPAVVEPVNSNAFPRKANMPDNECLKNLNLELAGLMPMRSWREALREYMTLTYNI